MWHRCAVISRAAIALAVVCVALPTLATDIHPDYGASLSPPDLDDGWPVATSGEAGFDEDAMLDLAMALNHDAYTNVYAVVVEHDGRLVFEQYLSGTDQEWGVATGHKQFDPTMLHDLRSITKSVTSFLLGIALGADHDEGLDQPVIDHFPERRATADPDIDSVTLRHALTMTAGLSWNEMTAPYSRASNDEIRMYRDDDPLGYILSRPVAEEPGARWYYNGGLTMIIAGVTEKLSGQPLADFAEDRLFEPLGITSYAWLGPASWDAVGMPSAASGLRLRARDLAKIGSLVLHGGRWQDQQIVPEEWIALSTQRYRDDLGSWSGDGTYGYGFQWWHGTFGEDDNAFSAITAVGYGGQRMFVIPEHDLVVTIFSGNYGSTDWWKSERLMNSVVAALR